MAKQTINLGTGELTGDGESIRSAFDKVNDNFDEVYARDLNTDAQTLSIDGNTISITGGNSVTIVPSVSLDGDLTGSVFADDSTLLVDGVNGTIPWAVVNGTPTTLAGYGITDSATFAQGALADSALQTVSFAQVTSPPTTLTGYGITDAATSAQGATADSALQSVAFTDLTTTPTTLAGYGITDAASTAQGVLADSALQSVAFTDLTATPTTLSAYGITDAASTAQGALADSAIQNGGSFDGDVTGSVFGDDSTVIVDAVNNSVIVNGVEMTGPGAYNNMIKIEGALQVEGGGGAVNSEAEGYYSKFKKGVSVDGDVYLNRKTTIRAYHQSMPTLVSPTGTVDLAISGGVSSSSTWYLYQPAVGCVTNLINLELYNNSQIVVTLNMYQGSTAVLPALQVAGVLQTSIQWQYGVVPTPAPNDWNVIQYQLMMTGGTMFITAQLGVYS